MRKTRFLSLFLSMVLMLSALSGAAVSAQDVNNSTVTDTADNAGAVAASPFADVTVQSDYEALKLLYDLNIIKGTGTTAQGHPEFTPDRPVSREEMALFIARIRSATPQYFLSDESQKTIFEDITDPTYFTAVNYCVEMDIINGYPDGSFKPRETVTLQEAAKMLVTALGYTALSYPVGYLSKANEPDVNILNGFQNVQGTKTLTRIEVARLLYNYFLSNYNYVDVTYNSIDKKYESTVITKPVCEKFGIEKITAYITGVLDNAISLAVKDTRVTAGEVILPGQALTAKETTLGNKNDIFISYYTTVSSTQNNATVVTPRIESAKMSKTRLGYASDFDASTLLGLKITMYRSIQNANVTVPTSYVTGTKTIINTLNETTTANTSATITGDNYDTIKSLVISGRAYDLNPPADITSRDIYTAGTSATYTNTSSSLLEVARFIANKGFYRLQYIDNGRDNQGNEENYYIFTPLQVGYYGGVDSDGKILLSGGAYGRTDADLTKNLSAGGTSLTLTKGEAYLYTIEGSRLNVYRQLHKVASGVTPSYIYGNVASFPNLTVTFGTSTQYLAKNALSTAASTIRAGGTYSVFSLSAGTAPFFVHETAEPTAIVSKDYAVIIADTGASSVIDGKVVYLYSTKTMYSNAETPMMVSAVNGKTMADTDERGKLRDGAAIAYRKTGNTYEVYTYDNGGFVNTNQDKAEITGNPLASSANFTYSTASGLLALTSSGKVGLVTGNTRFILVSDTLKEARTMTRSEFDAAMTASPVNATKLIMVTKTTAASEALIVILTANTTFTAPATAYNLGIVTVPNKGTVPEYGYSIATVYSYKLGTTVDVAGNPADLAFGNVVNISSGTITVGEGTVYNIGTIRILAIPTIPAVPAEGENPGSPEIPGTDESTITADTTFTNATTDLAKIIAVSDAAHQLTEFTNKSLVTYGAGNVKTLNAKEVNVITVTLYTNLRDNKANTSGTRAGNTVSNWALGTNVSISMGRTDLASITSNPAIFTGEGGAADIRKYYVHVNDYNKTGAADFITVVRYVINNTATDFPTP